MNFHACRDEYAMFLSDESRLAGQAEQICFPASEEEVASAVLRAWEARMTITTQGARTGIAGGAVPAGGLVVNLSGMNRVKGMRHGEDTGSFEVSVAPGVPLCALQQGLEKGVFDTLGWDAESQEAYERFRKAGPFFFTPDPTETTASLGGMASCNASGARSFKYGAMRNHVEGLRVVTRDGRILSVRRGRERAVDGAFTLTCEDGEILCGVLPATRKPDVSKCAAGYVLSPDMELIDLFIGAEGTLGVITELTLRLQPLPSAIWGIAVFLPEEELAWRLVRDLRRPQEGVPMPAALEYFDERALALLRGRKAAGHLDDLPAMKDSWRCAVYVEYHGEEGDLEQALERLCGLIPAYGGRDDEAWIADHPFERERIRLFRHAVPEAVNALIAERKKTWPELTKLGTDMAAPDECLEDMMRMYRDDLARSNLEYVVFGHIGNNHVHVNILPRNPEEYHAGKKLYLAWAERIVGMGGTVSAEHGIGKLKTPMLKLMVGEDVLHAWRELKRVFDPMGLFNPGTLFERAPN